jgi:2-aminoadipate transaminase
MIWNEHFAGRTAEMHRSTIREFLKLAAQPGMISFAGGLPAPELFPLSEIRSAAESVLARHGSKSLQYGETEGLRELRGWLAEQHGVSVENALITSGAQQALDLIGRVLLDACDPVAVENPTYLALLSAWRPIGVEYRPVAGDDEGLLVGEIPRKSKLLYVIPNFQNPQGTTLSRARREALVDRAQREHLVVVEDDPYGELLYEGEPLPSLFSLADGPNGPVLRVGTFSKVLAPGLRVGWVIAHAAVIEKLVLAKQPMDLHTSTWNQHLAFELVSSGFLPAHVAKLRATYRQRRDTMLAALTEFMPAGARWTSPRGGMFLLVTLPAGFDATALAAHAAREKVLIVPGGDFHVRGGKNTFRLNFSNAQPAAIRSGIAQLAEILKGFLATRPPRALSIPV